MSAKATAGLYIAGVVITHIEASEKGVYLIECGLTAFGACSLALTLIVTLLIMYRIISVGGVKRYRGILEIIAESSALYSIAFIIYLPIALHPVLWNPVPFAVLRQCAVRQ